MWGPPTVGLQRQVVTIGDTGTQRVNYYLIVHRVYWGKNLVISTIPVKKQVLLLTSKLWQSMKHPSFLLSAHDEKPKWRIEGVEWHQTTPRFFYCKSPGVDDWRRHFRCAYQAPKKNLLQLSSHLVRAYCK